MRSERWQRLGIVGTATDCGAGGDTFHVSCGASGYGLLLWGSCLEGACVVGFADVR